MRHARSGNYPGLLGRYLSDSLRYFLTVPRVPALAPPSALRHDLSRPRGNPRAPIRSSRGQAASACAKNLARHKPILQRCSPDKRIDCLCTLCHSQVNAHAGRTQKTPGAARRALLYLLSQVASRSISAHDEREIDRNRCVGIEHDIATAIGSGGEDGVDTAARSAGQRDMIDASAI